MRTDMIGHTSKNGYIILAISIALIVWVFVGCANQDAANPNRSFYDASNPQPKAFYGWMDKVSEIAASREINIDGDEYLFILYWKRGLAPSAAVTQFARDVAWQATDTISQRNQKYNEAIWPYVPEP